MKKVPLSLVVLLAVISAPANAEQPFLWGSLTAGPYRVGYRVKFLLDRSRTWKTTHGYDKPFSPDKIGRPIRLDVWYPASALSRQSMEFRDYIDAVAPKRFDHIQKILADRDRVIVGLDVPAGAVSAFRHTRVNAARSAAAAPGRFPLVLYFGGLNDAATVNVSVLAEFLASHGYVVATVGLIGPSESEPNQSRTATDIETTVRDMEFAWSTLRDDQHIDGGRLAVAGYSVGGIEAVVFAMRNGNVSAVLGLDGTYHFAGATQVLTGFYSYHPELFTASFLDLRRTASQDIDLTAIQALRHSDRVLVSLPKMHHSDFTAFAMWAEQFHLGNTPGYVDPSGWTRTSGYLGYQAVCRIALNALDKYLRKAQDADARLNAEVQSIGGTLEHLSALPPLPSVRDLADIVVSRGFDAGAHLVDELRRTNEEEIVDQRSCNALGYELLGGKDYAKAILVFRLCSHTHPASANAEDSLGDGYLAAGQEQLAIAAYERAAAVATDDPSIRAEDRRQFIEDEMAKARQLRAKP